jgi:hypothetical protein
MDRRGAREVAAGRLELLGGYLTAAVAREVPTKAEPAIRGAPIAYKEQDPVCVVMDEPLGNEIPGVANGIRGLVRKRAQLIVAGNKLGGNGVFTRVLAAGESGIISADAEGETGHAQKIGNNDL